jgi:hypothetical protein
MNMIVSCQTFRKIIFRKSVDGRVETTQAENSFGHIALIQNMRAKTGMMAMRNER